MAGVRRRAQRRPRPRDARPLRREGPPARRRRARGRRRRGRQVAPARSPTTGPTPVRGLDRRARPGAAVAAARARLRGARHRWRRLHGERARRRRRAGARWPRTSTTSGARRSPPRAGRSTWRGRTSAATTGTSSSRAPTTAGARSGPNVQVDDFPGFERVDERPSLAVDARGPRARRLDRPPRARARHEHLLRAQRQRRGDLLAQPPARRLEAAASTRTATRPRTSGTRASRGAGDTLFAAWQDNRLGNNDVFFTTSSDGGATFAPSERVDDTGAGHSEQSRPHMAWAEGRCHVVWEDNRSGNADVSAAQPALPPPRQGKKAEGLAFISHHVRGRPLESVIYLRLRREA